MKKCKNLEIHISHACNLQCESCSHYSNFPHTGLLSLVDAELWYGTWATKLFPRTFSLLGGEPTLHPKLCEHILLARKYWKKSTLRLVSNGFFLKNHPSLPEILKQVGRYVLEVSLHHNSDVYKEQFEPVQELIDNWCSQGIKIIVLPSYQKWTKRYHTKDGRIYPYADNKQRLSWERCPAKWCLQLYNNKLWKCPALAYLPLMTQRLGEGWDKYLQYKGLEQSCTQQELHNFITQEDQHFCTMCPSTDHVFNKPNPLRVIPIRAIK